MVSFCVLSLLWLNYSTISTGRAFSFHSDWIESQALLHLKLKQDASMI